MFHGNADWCKFERKLTCAFENVEFGKFLQAEESQFHFRKWNGATKSKSKFETTRSTRCSETISFESSK